MGMFYEIFIVVGVVLLVLISSSVMTLGWEYARTGQMSLAFVGTLHSVKSAHCVPPQHRQPSVHTREEQQ